MNWGNSTLHKRNKSIIRLLAVCFSFWLFALSTAQASDYPELSKKDKLIAAYLFNFTRFIQWPDLSERDPRSEIVICLQANSEINGFINELVAGRKVGIKQQQIVIKEFQLQARCDMVYVEQAGYFEQLLPVPATEQENVRESLQEVLVVASGSKVYPELAAISFYEQKKRLRFEVNMNKINDLKLDVSSELLKLARIK